MSNYSINDPHTSVPESQLSQQVHSHGAHDHHHDHSHDHHHDNSHDHSHNHSHDHDHSYDEDVPLFERKRIEMKKQNKKALKKLVIVIFITLIFVVAEVIGGIMANSIAIMSDAAHLTSDALGIGISVIALKIGERDANNRYTFGYWRSELLGALVSIIFIWIVTVWLIVEATLRLMNPEVINGLFMLEISLLCLVFNLIQMSILHSKDLHAHAHGPGQSCDHDHGEAGHGHSHDHAHAHVHGSDSCGSHDSHDHSHDNELVKVEAIKLDDDESGVMQEEDNARAELNGEKPKNNHSCKSTTINSTRPSTLGEAGFIANDEILPQCDSGRSSVIVQDIATDEEAAAIEEASKTKRNLNVQAAYLHILGDIVNSIGVIIASIIIWLSDGRLWYVDPICTYVFSIIVFYTTRITFMHCLRLLMEGTPAEISYDGMQKTLKKIPGVLSVHCLHIWCISDGKNAISMHLRAEPGSEPLLTVTKEIQKKYDIYHIACQVEYSDMDCGTDLHC